MQSDNNLLGPFKLNKTVLLNFIWVKSNAEVVFAYLSRAKWEINIANLYKEIILILAINLISENT